MKKIYNQNKNLISNIKRSIFELRKQNFYQGLSILRNAMSSLSENVLEVIKNKSYFNQEILTVEESYVMEVLSNITKAQNQKDYVVLADFMELQLIPMLIQWQQVIQSKEDVIYLADQYEKNMSYLETYDKNLYQLIRKNPDIETGYAVEPTTNGSVTIQVQKEDKSFYLISNNDPMQEARGLSDTYYNSHKSRYLIYGMELLNLANAFIINKNVPLVEVFESDINVIKLAVRYGNLIYLTNNRLQIFYDPDYTKFSKASKEQEEEIEVVMHYPSIQNIKESGVKERFEQLFLVDSSIRNQKDWMISNFYSNIKHCTHYVDELLPTFKEKDVYLVAAGPSLDKNIASLKDKPKNSLIIAVGTVHRKLIDMGIKPDFTIFSDANPVLVSQVSGLKDYDFSMIILSTACRELAKMGQGNKYLVCQYDFKEAQEYAKANEYHLYQTGGSVITVALDISLQLKAKRVILLGADMAYTNNQGHATGTLLTATATNEGLFPVKAVDGETVYTTRVLNMYREWIERRIAKEKQIEVIDASEGGALIKGTKICTLEEIIKKNSIKDIH